MNGTNPPMHFDLAGPGSLPDGSDQWQIIQYTDGGSRGLKGRLEAILSRRSNDMQLGLNARFRDREEMTFHFGSFVNAVSFAQRLLGFYEELAGKGPELMPSIRERLMDCANEFVVGFTGNRDALADQMARAMWVESGHSISDLD